jgi:hypothetical protein
MWGWATKKEAKEVQKMKTTFLFGTVPALALFVGIAACASPAFAEGYWHTMASDNACTLTTRFDDGRGIGIGLARNSGLLALVEKPSWAMTSGANVAASVQIDNYAPLSGPGTVAPQFPSAIGIPVAPQNYNALIREMLDGWWATVHFSGNEPPWRVSLWGVRSAWPSFVQCARRVSPMFVNQLYGGY